MRDKNKKTVILGAGLAGLACGWKLAESGVQDILILEKNRFIGGLAASLSFCGTLMDMGSHRIHPGYLPEVYGVIDQLLDNGLIRLPRRGRLLLNGRYMRYPPSFIDFAGAVGLKDTALCGFSLASAKFGARDYKNYESYLKSIVGARTYEIFYAPYARKIYGMDPAKLSVKAAKTRGGLTGSHGEARRNGANGYFYYPASGFGAIADRFYKGAVARGADAVTGVKVLELKSEKGKISEVVFESSGQVCSVRVNSVISSIPVNHLVSLIHPMAPIEISNRARSLRWRGIRLLQVKIARGKCLDGETYYFPEEKYVFGRISEPKWFSPYLNGADGSTTTLNIEVIATPGDHLWRMDETEFFEKVMDDIESAGVIKREQVLENRSLFLNSVYPVYDTSFQANLDKALSWLKSFENLHSIGRGGMFFHGNADHSIHIGLKTAENLAKGNGAKTEWMERELEFFRVRD